MEIDITDFVLHSDPSAYSASAAELGSNAGTITWRNALSAPEVLPRKAIDHLRDYMRDYGAWDSAEIDSWSYAECNAMFVQEISARMREADITSDMTDDDWSEVQRRAEAGEVSSSIYPGEDGRIYFYIGC